MVKIKEVDLVFSVLDMPTAFAPVPAPFLFYFHKQLQINFVPVLKFVLLYVLCSSQQAVHLLLHVLLISHIAFGFHWS